MLRTEFCGAAALVWHAHSCRAWRFAQPSPPPLHAISYSARLQERQAAGQLFKGFFANGKNAEALYDEPAPAAAAGAADATAQQQQPDGGSQPPAQRQRSFRMAGAVAAVALALLATLFAGQATALWRGLQSWLPLA